MQLRSINLREWGICPFSNIYKVSVGIILERMIMMMIFKRWRSYFCQLYNIRWLKYNRLTQRWAITEPCCFKDEFAGLGNMSPGIDKYQQNKSRQSLKHCFLQFYKLFNCIWVKEE
jgi:hypothetical protein